jgi:syntaxin 18
MIAPVDRTAELHASMPRAAGRPPPRAAAHAIAATHVYTVQTAELSRQIASMQRELVSQRRRYVDFSSTRGLSDAARDALDASVASFLRGCVAQIDRLKAAAVTDLKRGTGDASFPAHRLGGVAILNEQLQGVSKLSEELRHARVRAAIDARTAPQAQYSKKAAGAASRAALEREAASAGGDAGGASEGAAEMEMYAQEFASENAALVGELVETRERVREAERTVVEIATLNQLFASKVLEQGREIETLYELAVEATMFVDRGNRELRKMKGKGPILKYYVGGGLLVLISAMFFLDWMASRRSIFLPML